jgi:ribose/xylose/arabinose/galactoside ABC-type transport system permease subunit
MEIPNAATSEKASGESTRQSLSHTVFSRELALAAVTIFTVIIFWILYPTSFASFRNFSAILRNLAFEGILAIGMMIMLIGGNFDLSVGSMASMIGICRSHFPGSGRRNFLGCRARSGY